MLQVSYVFIKKQKEGFSNW